MTQDIRGLEQWEGEAKEWAKNAGELKARAGIGMVEALESWYRAWLKKPTNQNTREYMTWRLRLHLKWNGEPEFLEEIPPEFHAGITTGFNWRRDAGHAIKGGATHRKRRKSRQDLEERDD